MTNYSKGKIYKLTNTIDNKIYVGSTVKDKLYMRLSGHKWDCLHGRGCKKVRDHFNTIGWKNARIELIENYPCRLKKELLLREKHFKNLLNAELNMKRPIRTREELRGDVKKWNRTHYLKNRDKLIKNARKRRRKYRQKNKIYRKQEYECECGTILTRGGMYRHNKTHKHHILMNKKNN